MGVLLFLLANGIDPMIMKFKKNHIDLFPDRLKKSPLRLDEDEKLHSFFLLSKTHPHISGQYINHVEKIHLHKDTCDLALIPDHIRDNLLRILNQYTDGFCELKNNAWVSGKKPEILV
jgi:hypothetical protein